MVVGVWMLGFSRGIKYLIFVGTLQGSKIFAADPLPIPLANELLSNAELLKVLNYSVANAKGTRPFNLSPKLSETQLEIREGDGVQVQKTQDGKMILKFTFAKSGGRSEPSFLEVTRPFDPRPNSEVPDRERLRSSTGSVAGHRTMLKRRLDELLDLLEKSSALTFNRKTAVNANEFLNYYLQYAVGQARLEQQSKRGGTIPEDSPSLAPGNATVQSPNRPDNNTK